MPTDDNKDDHRDVNLRLNPNLSTIGLQFPPPPSQSSPRFLSLLLKAIIMTLIISLFLMFLGVAAVALLHIFVAGSVLHRGRNHRRTTPLSDADAASYVVDFLKFLPRLKFGAGLAETTRDCVVCLESFKEGEWCRILPMCNHIFHENCVDTWLTKVPNCPICRNPVRLNSGASASVINNDDCQLLWAVGV